MLSSTTKEILDKFGPFWGAIGVFIGLMLYNIYSLIYEIQLTGFEFIILGYMFCTCTHRKYLIYSAGGVGCVIGAIVGFFVIGLLCAPFSMAIARSVSRGYVSDAAWFELPVLYSAGVALFAFFFSRYFCRRARRKEMQRKTEAPNRMCKPNY